MIELVNPGITTRAAIFDGDDTLWRTEVLYDKAREAVRNIISNQRIDADKWEARQRLIDVQNVAVYGFSSERFPTSCLQAFKELWIAADRPIDVNLENKIVYEAQSVFRNRAELVPHVTNVLGTLRSRGVRLALLTKGDPRVQANRIEQSGLASVFEVIEIIQEKTTTAFRTMLQNLNADGSNTWAIGNSLRSDILPALELGVRGIWIDAPVWEYERSDGTFTELSIFKATDFRDILRIID
jgi:putative hydrolase of the HAD superfamily